MTDNPVLSEELMRLGEASNGSHIQCRFNTLAGESKALYNKWSVRERVSLLRLHRAGVLGALDFGTVDRVLSKDPEPWAAAAVQRAREADMAAAALNEKIQKDEEALRKLLQEEEEALNKKILEEEEDLRKKLEADTSLAAAARRRQLLGELDHMQANMATARASELDPEALSRLANVGDAHLADYIQNIVCSEDGLNRIFRRASSAAETSRLYSRTASIGSGARWCLWSERDGRAETIKAMCLSIASVILEGYCRGDGNIFVVPGPRGVGKSVALLVGALAAFAMSHAPFTPAPNARAVPVVIDCKPSQAVFKALCDCKLAVTLRADLDPLAAMVDRALQQAGVKQRWEDFDDANGGDYPWLGSMPEVNHFLSQHNLVLFLVLDEIDEFYKVSGQLSESITSMEGTTPHISLWMTATTAHLKTLLYNCEEQQDRLANLGFKHKYRQLHSGKVQLLPPMLPMVTLEEHAAAMQSLGILRSPDGQRTQMVQAAKAFTVTPHDYGVRLRLAEEVLQRGSAPRALLNRVWRPGNIDMRPATMVKMQNNIPETIAHALALVIEEALPGIVPETIIEVLAGTDTKAASGMTIDECLPTFTEKQLLGQIEGIAVGNESASTMPVVLASLSDAGVVTPHGEPETWCMSSWFAVAAVLEQVRSVSLSLAARTRLLNPELDDAQRTSETVLARAAVRGALDNATLCVNVLDDDQRAEWAENQARFARAAYFAEEPFVNERLLRQVPVERGKELEVPAVNQVFAPDGKIGFDAFGVHVHSREQRHVDVSVLEMKASGRFARDGEIPSLSKVNRNVESMLDSCPSNAEIVAAVQRLVQEVESVRVWFVLVSNREAGAQALETATGAFANKLQSSPYLHECTINNVVVQSPGMLVCKRDAVVENMPPLVQSWAEERRNAQYCPAAKWSSG